MTKEFWKAALARCLHTIVQTAVGMIGATALIEQVNWLAVLSASALAGVVSILKSIMIGMPETEQPKTVTKTETKVIYLDEYGHEISEAEVEAMCPIKILAHEKFDENGDQAGGENV